MASRAAPDAGGSKVGRKVSVAFSGVQGKGAGQASSRRKVAARAAHRDDGALDEAHILDGGVCQLAQVVHVVVDVPK